MSYFLIEKLMTLPGVLSALRMYREVVMLHSIRGPFGSMRAAGFPSMPGRFVWPDALVHEHSANATFVVAVSIVKTMAAARIKRAPLVAGESTGAAINGPSVGLIPF
jgi:hypothetical protein